MRTVPYPVEYKEWVEKNIRTFNLRVKFGTRTLTASDIVSIRINSDLFTTDSFTIGSVVAETLEFTIFTDTVFGNYNYNTIVEDMINNKAPIIPFISLYTERINEFFETVVEWQEVCLGVFYINPDGVNEDGLGVMSIRASCMFTHPDYSTKTLEAASSNSTAERDLYSIINNLVYRVDNGNNPNFTLKNTDLPDIIIPDKSGNIIGKTVREAINYVATLYGGYARTTYNESENRVYLEFFRKQETNYVYDESSYVNLTRGGAGSGLNITYIKCKTDKATYITSGSGSLTTNTVHLECPDMTQEQLDVILANFKNYNFRPTTTKIFGNPLLEVGDIVTVKGRGINSAGDELPLHSIVYNITGSGITMDIKSLYKVADVAKYVAEQAKEKEEEPEEDEESFKESVENDIKELYDRTTIQYEDEEEGLPLITLKENYLETKETLEEDIKSINGKQTELEKKLNEHIESSSSTPSNPGTSVNPLQFCSTNINEGTLVGSIATGVIGSSSTNRRNELCVSSEPGCALSLGVGTSDDVTIVSNTRNLIIADEDFANSGTRYYKGVNITDATIYNTMKFTDWMELRQDENGNHIGYGELYISTSSYPGFNVYGEYNLDLGIKPGGVEKTAFYIYHNSISNTAEVSLRANMSCGGNTISNVIIEDEVSGQSEYTTNLINDGTIDNKIYNNMSYDSGEVRWCWKETVFTYKEADVDPETDEWVYTGRHICYIELPIFMAENIQNDYHINVSKMSWGDYRIIEKTPYYFILESQEDNFAFTFEVVAKLNDNQTLNNNAIIANTGYED